MSRRIIIFIALLIIAIGALVISFNTPDHKCWLCDNLNKQATSTENAPGTPNSSVDQSYINNTYGFKIDIPKGFTASTSFKGFYHIQPNWRFDASETSGTPLLSILAKRIENGEENLYPRYYDAEIRIGVSEDPTEVANCLKAVGNPTPPTDVEINGTIFKRFDLSSAAMMQYLRGESYRLVKDGACIAIERFETGANYRDDQTVETISDADLKQFFDSLEPVLKTFQFTK